MLKLGLIGVGISRTQVHRLHGLLGELCGIEVQYDLFDIPDVDDFDLQARLRQCEREGYAGVNVTHPFKLRAFALLDDVSRLPAGLTSVNTVRFDQGTWRGDNTDYTGFMASFRGHFGNRAPGTVLMMGAGGVGVAIAFALARLGARSVAIHDVEAERAVELAGRLLEIGTEAHALNGSPEELVRWAAQADGLINATPVGMYQYPGNPFPERCIAGRRWAFDAVYTPRDTEFVRAAQRHGLSVIGGFELFLHQGIDAFEHFSGHGIDRDRAIAAYRTRYPQTEATAGEGSFQARNP